MSPVSCLFLNPESFLRSAWQIWLAYVASLAIVVVGVAWLSLRALEAERAEAEARSQAALEENTRLALWRMDTAKASLISDEAARPYFAYMTVYPVERAYGQMFKGKATSSPLLLSPLATPLSAEVLVHFQIGPDGRLTSPQVPVGPIREQIVPQFLSEEQVAEAQRHLRRLEPLLEPAELVAQLPPLEAAPMELPWSVGEPRTVVSANQPSAAPQVEGPPAAAPVAQTPNQPPSRSSKRSSVQRLEQQQQAYYGAPVQQALAPTAPEDEGQQQVDSRSQVAQGEQRARGANEFQARSAYVVNSLNTSSMRQGNYGDDLSRVISGGEIETAMAADVRSSRMMPYWISGNLVLLRRVSVNGSEYLQGCLLDWPAIREELLASIADLLARADLAPLDGAAEDGSRLLASLPVRLLPGTIEMSAEEGLSPTHQSLVVTWASMLVGALAVAVLLQGVMALSERRAAFVSAVTHELRTPLTTFRMYAEMLADGMVADESSRQRYLNTLRIEADRLTHLVENVLAYARLERGGAGGRIAPVEVSMILHKHGDRMAERAEQAGLELLINADEATLATKVLADASAVEQILFNLVDNACKYAAGATNKRLHLEAVANGKVVQFFVRDFGPGISKELRRRLFQPFRKSADEAARSAPGVGLGLALSRRLARQMGGDLHYEENGVPGASFALTLARDA